MEILPWVQLYWGVSFAPQENLVCDDLYNLQQETGWLGRLYQRHDSQVRNVFFRDIIRKDAFSL